MSPLWVVLVLLPVLGAGERFSCRGRILGGYYADVKSGCRAFHVCVRVAGGGIRDFRFFCPPGTLFQQEAQTCTDWGDDDGLACPADLYDGQFDLYKIGSGLKVPSGGQRNEDTEFSLQRAETGDRRVSNQQSSSSQPQSDLRAAHSSDFFSGRRERGREDASSPSDSTALTAPPAPPSTRAPYRRPPSRASPRSSTFATQPPPELSSPASPFPYEPQHKRKLIRKRPLYVSSSTSAPTEYTTASKQYFRSTKSDYEKFTPSSSIPSETPRPSYVNEDNGFVDVIKVSPKIGRYDAPSEKPRYNENNGLTEVYNYNTQATPNYNNFHKNHNYNNQNNNFDQNNDFSNQNNEENFNNQNNNLNNQNHLNNQNNYNNQNNNFNSQNNNFNNQNKNFNSQNANNENFNTQNNNLKNSRPENSRAFKATVRNNFSVAPPADFTAENEVRKNVEVSPNGVQRPTGGAYDKSTRNIGSSTPSYRNFNSVSYDAGKKFNPKQNFANSPTTPDYENTRFTEPLNINTVAYKTNVGFETHPINYAESEEDDGQYRLPTGEDDGQYRPELYERERELLSGAHSLNIAASKNRLLEDVKPHRHQQTSQTAAPRPFSAAAPSAPPPRPTENFQYQTTPKPQRPRPTENFQPIATTPKPQPRPTENFQPYPTTSKPQPRPTENFQPYPTSPKQQPTVNYPSYPTTGKSETSAPAQTTFEYSNSVFTTRRPATTVYIPSTQHSPAPSSVAPQPFKQDQEPVRPVPAQKVRPQPTPSFAKPVKGTKEDSSYDYAYYDSDPGFSEYDQIEEFGKTKSKA